MLRSQRVPQVARSARCLLPRQHLPTSRSALLRARREIEECRLGGAPTDQGTTQSRTVRKTPQALASSAEDPLQPSPHRTALALAPERPSAHSL
eukprot:scaffold770_cov255-Pinguiococcus_pyrenoidosus.AAC.78